MMKHWKYLKYVLRHKWYVFVYCLQYGLIWQGIIHDLSKFKPSEWFPYVNYFYGEQPVAAKVGRGYPFVMGITTYFREDCERDFDKAWNHHQKRNPHHWQYWVLMEDSGDVKCLEMPLRYKKEMLADWRGAGMALGNPDTKAWYLDNRHKMQLHPGTRAWIERELRIIWSVWDDEPLLYSDEVEA